MKIIHTPVSTMFVNCYFYYDENTRDAVVIDPGAETDKLMDVINSNCLTLKAILLTHGHFDHIGAVNELHEMTGAPVFAYETEEELLKSTVLNESVKIGRRAVIVNADKLLTDGEMIEVGEGRLTVLHTPGHTSGGACFYDEQNHVVFVGDTLFRESVGRSDLATGSQADLFHNIKTKLFTMPDDVKAFPGHGGATTIGHEKQHNPYVGIRG